MRLILFIFLFFGGFSVNAQINPKLLAAIQANDLAAVKTINPAPAMLNAQDKNGASALMWAAYKGDLAMVQYLVEQGADHQLQGAICLDDTCGGYYGNLTGIAAGEGKLNMLRYFIEDLKIPVDDVEWNPVTREKDGWTGLTWACNNATFKSAAYLTSQNVGNADTSEIIYCLERLAGEKFQFFHCKNLDSLTLFIYDQSIQKYSVFEQDDYTLTIAEFKDKIFKEGQGQSYQVLFSKLLKIWEQIEEKKGRYYAVSLNNTGFELLNKGSFKKAEKYFEESLKTWKKLEKIDTSEITFTLCNLSTCQILMVQNEISSITFATAESTIIKYQNLTKKVFGEESYEYANVLHVCGRLYGLQDDYQSVQYYKKCLELKIRIKQNYPKSIFETACSLAYMYGVLGKYDLKYETYQNLLDTILAYHRYDEKILSFFSYGLGEKSEFDYLWLKYDIKVLDLFGEEICARNFKNRVKSNYHFKKKNYDLAKIYLKAYLANENFQTNYLALAYEPDTSVVSMMMAYTKSHERATFGIIDIKYKLSFTYNLLGNLDSCYIWYKAYFDDIKKFLQQPENINAFDYNVNGEFENNSLLKQEYFSYAYSLYFQRSDAHNFENPFNIALLRKNYSLERAQDVIQYANTSDNTNFVFKINVLRDIQRFLIDKKQEISDIQFRKVADEYKSKIEWLQSDISKIYYSDTLNAFKPVEWQQIKSALKPSEAAVEFIDFRLFRNDWTDSILYYAMIIRPEWEVPRFIYLFEEHTISKILNDEKNQVTPFANNIYRGIEFSNQLIDVFKDSPEAGIVVDRKSHNLNYLIWDKIDSLLLNARTVYYSTTGYLNRLNLGAIANQNNQTALERYLLKQLLSTRRVLKKRSILIPFRSKLPLKYDKKANQVIKNQTALLIGGLEYSADSLSLSKANENFGSVKKSANRSILDIKDISILPFDNLKSTLDEVYKIDNTLKKYDFRRKVLTGLHCTEQSLFSFLRSAGSPAVFHIATHGFFFGKTTNISGIPLFQSKSGMVRSGIALSGCNHFLTTEKSYSGGFDNILTAYEAAQLDLTSTELVVLSACETALGDLNVEGGVFGLQRAFIQAGAHYVMMSLWKVDDSTTQEFMTTFYEKWLQDKKSIPDAFQETQIAIRKAHPNPYFWAPFIIVE